MNKPLATVELSLATVTKRQRLQRFANVIRSVPRVPLHLFINLEYRDAGEWKYLAHPSVVTLTLVSPGRLFRGFRLPTWSR